MAKKPKEVPVFIVNGFLESGKTRLIKEICENNEEYHNETTVIVVCETGEIEYDEAWCKQFGIIVEYVENEDDLTSDFMKALDDRYMPDRFVIEFNSFFDIDNFDLPRYMVVYQQITLINAKSFNVMFNNMKKIFQLDVKNSSLIIFNRCDGVGDLAKYRRQIRAMNQQAQIAFEQENGSLTTMLDEDLPYDITKDVIRFEDDVYPTWYSDVFDNYKKYFGKTICFKTVVRDITPYSLVCGRNVMVCCANDVQFLGYEVINKTSVKPNLGDFIYLECEVKHEYSQIAKEEVVMLYAKNITVLPKEEDKTLGM